MNLFSVALVQMTSSLEPKENMEKLHFFLSLAKKQHCDYVFLPECFYSLSDGEKPTTYIVSKGNEHYEAIRSLAKTYSLFLLGGSVVYQESSSGPLFNRCLNFDPQGEELGFYDKNHLFTCHIPHKVSLDESVLYTSGKTPSILRFENNPSFVLGLSICFDLRFPELYAYYRRQGTTVISLSAAFTVPTGMAHWHTLLRARAIETQCFICASAQWGKHNEKISTYGHSLIYSPWGDLLVEAGEGEKLVTATLDMTFLTNIRQRISLEKALNYSQPPNS